MKFHPARAAALALAIAIGAAPVLAADAAKDPVVAVVNGKDIHKSKLVETQRALPPLRQVPMEAVYDQLLEHVINSQILLTEARKANLQDDPDVKKKLKEIEEQLVQNAFLKKKIDGQITDESMKASYDQTVKGMPPREEVKARHILVDKEDAAKEIIGQLKSGASFEDLAKSKSADPAGQNGGDLGYFAKEDMVPAFSEAAFALKPGQITETPVKTQFGWHVIKVEDRRTAPPPKFEEVKDQIRSQMTEDAALKVVGELRSKAEVKRFNADGTPMAEKK
ncbi:MAG: peptidylprolyl isomerase [Rhodospirillales bacterium]|nr:peptidylprolyl isomerase [Rhodospirillales bacterium]